MADFADQVKEILEDHTLILAMLARFERACNALGADAEAPRLLEHTMRFLEYFAEGYHHNKEEGEFFGVLRASGLLQIADMLQADHRNGIAQLQALQRALPAASEGDARALGFLQTEGSHYIALTREHMRQENDILRVLLADGQSKPPAADTRSRIKVAAPRSFDRSAGGRAR